MRDDYSGSGIEVMKEDSLQFHQVVKDMDPIKISTPGLGLGDNFQTSSVIAAIYDHYDKRPIINCYHPPLFEGNPKCQVGTNTGDPGNIPLHTWPMHHQPAGVRLSTSEQYNYRVGLPDAGPYRTEFYPTQQELIWGAQTFNNLKPYITVQYQPDPPRKFYNISPNLGRSDSDKRWMSCTDWYMDRWTEVVKATKEMGYNVVQIGCQYEEPIEGCFDARQVGVRKTFMAVGLSELLIGHESFPQFCADAMDKPCLVFITGRSCQEGQYLPTRIPIEPPEEVGCSPCWNKGIKDIDAYCPRTCMESITPDMVIGKIKEVLGG